jgi:hypothetical protein
MSWIAFDPAQWIADTSDLDLAETGVFSKAWGLIAAKGGPVSRDHLRRACGGHARPFNRALERLIELGKIVVGADGLLNIERCETELKKAQKAVERSHINGQKHVGHSNKNNAVENLVGSNTRATGRVESREESKTKTFEDSPRAGARAGLPPADDAGLVGPAERKERWQHRMIQEAHATMPPTKVGALVLALMQEPVPPWAKAELERLDRQVNGRGRKRSQQRSGSVGGPVIAARAPALPPPKSAAPDAAAEPARVLSGGHRTARRVAARGGAGG